MQRRCGGIKKTKLSGYYDSNASLFEGGESSASAFNEASSFSTLRFVPPSFDCGGGECDALTAVITPGLGGVDRDECTSGVPARLPDVNSFRRRAAKLFVDATASA
jgi:hypothetical protein